MSEPRVLTRPFALPPAARGEWLAPIPCGGDAWAARAREVRASFDGRAWLDALAPALDATGAAASRLERSAARGVVITTGQQPGLFGGPMYSWSKALSALALADAHERATGIATAPVFWAATYDADFAEAAVSYVAIGDHVDELRLPPPEQPGRAMRDTPLADCSELLARVERAAGAAAGREALDIVRDSYAPGATVGSAFVRLLRAVLEPLGIAVLDAGHPAVRAAARPLLLAALERAPAIDQALRERESEMRAAGVRPKVPHVKGLSLVFHTVDERRTRVPMNGTTNADRSNADRFADLEPNVLLRPIAERAILPTVAYAAGPGELAYFAQTTAVAAALDAPAPVALPRWSGLVLEPHVERILRRYELDVDSLRDPHAAETRLARARVPGPVRAALERYRVALDEGARTLGESVRREPPPLVPDAVLEGARRAVEHRLDRLERRIVAAAKRRESEMLRDLAVARASLFPRGEPQERVLNFIPFLARHGARLLELARARAAQHADELIATGATAALAATE